LEDFERFINEKTNFSFVDKIISFNGEERVLLSVLKKG
jgi:hypothetical protein